MAAARTREISPVLISKGSQASKAQSGFCVEICLHCRDIGSKSKQAELFIFSLYIFSIYTNIRSVNTTTHWAVDESW